MKVLLIEDDAGIGRFVCNGLRAHGIDVEWLRLAGPALQQLHTGSYSAVVLDLMLPDSDGFALCRTLRASGITTPVCILTARDGLDDKLEGFDAGADDYLTKPFFIDELVARLRVMVRRDVHATSSSRLVVGGLVVDMLARAATLDGIALDLTRREFDVLAFLAQNAGQAVTRERILLAAWGPAAEVTPNAIDVYVGYVRRKMKTVAEQPTIVTVRGIGFKLA